MYPANAAAPMLVRPKDLAIQLSIGRATLWRWVKKGILPQPMRIGGIAAWRLSDIEKMLVAAKANSNRARGSYRNGK